MKKAFLFALIVSLVGVLAGAAWVVAYMKSTGSDATYAGVVLIAILAAFLTTCTVILVIWRAIANKTRFPELFVDSAL